MPAGRRMPKRPSFTHKKKGSYTNPKKSVTGFREKASKQKASKQKDTTGLTMDEIDAVPIDQWVNKCIAVAYVPDEDMHAVSYVPDEDMQ